MGKRISDIIYLFNLGYHMGQKKVEPIYNKIEFSMQKKVEFGRAVFICGNISKLGGWKIQNSFRLQWSEGDFWKGDLVVAYPEKQAIQFKYIVADWQRPQNSIVEWEAGETNRKIQLQGTLETIKCENTWNMEKITFHLCILNNKICSEFGIVGNCRELGNWKKSLKMNKSHGNTEKCLSSLQQRCDDGELSIHSVDIEVFRGKSHIHYYYVKNTGGIFQTERHPGRKYYLSEDKSNHSKCFKITHKSGDTQLFEICDFKALNYSKVTNRIFLGAYIKNEEDLRKLKMEGVNSIFCIQTEQDIAAHRLSEEYLEQICERNGMALHIISIKDMSRKDFISKCLGAIALLGKIMKDGTNKVYVHCSAGMYRSPQIVVLYLALLENYHLADAMKMVQEKHSFARPDPGIVNDAFNLISTQIRQHINTVGI